MHTCPHALQCCFTSNSTLWGSSMEREKVLISCAHTGNRMIYQPANKQCKQSLWVWKETSSEEENWYQRKWEQFSRAILVLPVTESRSMLCFNAAITAGYFRDVWRLMVELAEASPGRSFVKYKRQCRILKWNTKSCLISKLSIRGQLAETMLSHYFADSTNLIISPSARSKKAAPSSDMKEYVNQQLRGTMLCIFSL